MTSYDELISKKVKRPLAHGFEPSPMNSNLFDWQKLIVEWAVRQGRCALFEDCGLGKTLQQLEWARQVCQHTGGSVLILTPLAVSDQTQRESCKFGIQSCLASCDEDITSPGIWITNYEKLDKFDCGQFAGVVLDESSILKSFTGKTRKELTAAFSQTPYRLCCTATPSPNDYTELGQHAEFLGICTPAQMLATYFINDTFNTGDWRLKKHAEPQFWRWLAGWAACVSVVNILHESLSDASTDGAVVQNAPQKQTTQSALSELDLLWGNLLEAVGRVSQFTRGYLQEAYPVSFNGKLFTLSFPTEFADYLSLVDNPKNHAVLQCKMAELGYADCKIMFVTHESDSASEDKHSSC